MKYTRRYIRKADRVYDPDDPYRFSYEHSTPESEAEFYRIFGPPVAFTRPGMSPAATPTTPEPQPPPAAPLPPAKRGRARRSRRGQ